MLNILIAGVGGQGTLLASRVLGKYALDSGFDCKLSEVHGMGLADALPSDAFAVRNLE